MTIGPAGNEKELAALAEIGAMAFGSPADRVLEWLKRLGPEVTRAYRRRGEVLGGLVLHEMGQWFGGRSVPMTGVAMVCVAPQHRAGGIATALMRAALREIQSRHVPLSTLYAATVPLYRRVGYEAAGGRYEITLPANQIRLRERGRTLRRAGPEDEALDAAYRWRMARENGPLDRQVPGWRHALRANVTPRNPIPLTYTVWNGRRIEGYVRYAATREDRTLQVYGLIANTPEAGRRLLTFLGDHRSTIETIVWYSSPNDPLLLLLPEHAYRVRLAAPWMLRLVDVRRALEGRGYPAAARASVSLRVADELFPANRGPFTLEVEGGRAAVRRGGRGTATIDVRGLAALYTGHLSAAQLALTGYLEATPAEIDALQAIFAGPTPWMADSF